MIKAFFFKLPKIPKIPTKNKASPKINMINLNVVIKFLMFLSVYMLIEVKASKLTIKLAKPKRVITKLEIETTGFEYAKGSIHFIFLL